MAKKPTPKRKPALKKTAKPAGLVGRPPSGEKVPIALRLPPAVLVGVDARAKREGLSRNDALIKACLDFGDFPDGRPDIKREPRTVASQVATAEREPEKPGARLDKAAIGRRTGPPISKTAPKAAPLPAKTGPWPTPPAVEEEAV